MISKVSRAQMRQKKHRRLRNHIVGTAQRPRKAELEKTNNVDAAAYLGTVLGKKAVEAGITEVVFDRGGFIYQGKIQAFADAAREAGLVF